MHPWLGKLNKPQEILINSEGKKPCSDGLQKSHSAQEERFNSIDSSTLSLILCSLHRRLVELSSPFESKFYIDFTLESKILHWSVMPLVDSILQFLQIKLLNRNDHELTIHFSSNNSHDCALFSSSALEPRTRVSHAMKSVVLFLHPMDRPRHSYWTDAAGRDFNNNFALSSY
ncbi:hypothetical protein VNO77_23362 [Canavalia gladiata]|uniref:Uncharacterized protein n=1 Tax=Canavalia gladiata TaxID=3824 RepID=A0AAN9L6S9_CANGL